MTLQEQIDRDIEQQNFKSYQDADGNIHWIPASKQPKDGWIELIEDPNELPDPNFEVDWRSQRQNLYPDVKEQLNVLFDDIKSGKFGEAAKTSDWVNMIQTVKDAIPKK